jgi:hypothetical protein
MASKRNRVRLPLAIQLVKVDLSTFPAVPCPYGLNLLQRHHVSITGDRCPPEEEHVGTCT